MKQLTILCSSDLSETVRDVLVDAGVDGFLKIPNAVGNRPGAAAEHGRLPYWEAEVFIAPAEDEVVERVATRLKEYTRSCELDPCLRVLVAPVEAVY